MRKTSLNHMMKFLQQLSSSLAPAVQEAAAAAAAAAGPAETGTTVAAGYSSSSRGQQATASAVFLLVLMGRGLVVVHNAAASQTDGAPLAAVEQAAEGALVAVHRMVHRKMHDLLSVFSGVWQALQALGLLTPGTAMCAGDNPAGSAAATAQPAAGSLNAEAVQMEQARSYSCGSASSSSSNSSSTGPPVCWQYLLRLHESRKLAAAAAAFSARWSQDEVQSVVSRYQKQAEAEAAAVAALTLEELDVLRKQGRLEELRTAPTTAELLQTQQLYRDVLCLCRTLTAVAQLPVVCNNPGCAELGGVSEAAAAHYVCAGCGCRYCSAACQAAGWRSHKKTCRRMAACGMRVDGKR
jgi:hypothetical protein